MIELFEKLFSFYFRNQNIDKILKYPKARRFYKEHHLIREYHIDPDALKVIYRINSFGYTAYLVGGSVRDLLLQKKPKDFDIVTNATPKELTNMFNNSRIIGKRFKIIHIFFNGGRKTIEITTSRSLPKRGFKSLSRNQYLAKDNYFGSFRDDIARRDLTINALLFDPKKEIIIDYVGGVDDIKNKRIEIIGDESYSFPEDPVRIIRTIKFASIYDFSISDKTIKYIQKYIKHLNKVSRNRFHEEFSKIFYSGKSFETFKKIYDFDLFRKIFPNYFELASAYSPNWGGHFEQTLLGKVLRIADDMIQEYHEINTNTYFALLALSIFEDPLQIPKKIISDRLQKISKEFALHRKVLQNMFTVYRNQPLFDQKENDENLQTVLNKKNQDTIIESFIVYKTYARAMSYEDKIQHSLFWEMHLPTKVTNPIKKKRYFHMDDKGKDGNRPRFPSHYKNSPKRENKNNKKYSEETSETKSKTPYEKRSKSTRPNP